MEPSERRVLFTRLMYQLRLRRSYSDTTLCLLPRQYKFDVAPQLRDSFGRHGTVLAFLEAENAGRRRQSESLFDKGDKEQNE